MKVFFDTNVLVAAVLEEHEHHERALAVVRRAIQGKEQGIIAAHSLVEAYAVMTRLPVPMRVSPQIAWSLLQDNFVDQFACVTLTAKEYTAFLTQSAKRNLLGGIAYDVLLLSCASKAQVKRLYSFNVKHFELLAGQAFEVEIVKP